MSSREPMWFCHQCHEEMTPMMTPEPRCAQCNGTFVEKLEDPSDDPRNFQADGFGPDPYRSGNIFNSSMIPRFQYVEHRRPGYAQGPRFHLEIRSPGPSGTYIQTGPDIGRGDVPTMSEFLAQAGRNEDGTVMPAILMQYIMAMAGRAGDPALLSGMFGPLPGRPGDYVLNQEAFEQIMTRLMENSNASRPVPAPESVISDLPREVLEVGSPTLEKDCAVCKDQFKLETEDPDEQVVATLPCQHTFHEGCIVPWLQSNGTCPVCRHSLVPQPNQQPNQQPPQNGPSSSSSFPSSFPSSSSPPPGGFNDYRPRSPDTPRRSPRSYPTDRSPGGSGGAATNAGSSFTSRFFPSLFGSSSHDHGHNRSSGHGHGSGSRNGGGGSSSRQNNASSRRRSRADSQDPLPPGGWTEQVD